jgi:hypothetical protein
MCVLYAAEITADYLLLAGSLPLPFDQPPAEGLTGPGITKADRQDTLIMTSTLAMLHEVDESAEGSAWDYLSAVLLALDHKSPQHSPMTPRLQQTPVYFTIAFIAS